MFTFPESEYQWCPSCAGNIRKEAIYCRYCKKPVQNRLVQQQQMPPIVNINDVAQWVPYFNNTMLKCSKELQIRFEKVDDDHPVSNIGIPEGVTPEEYRDQQRETGVCPHQPPEPHVAGLLMDILLSIHGQGASLVDICDHPLLKIIEMTPQEVAAEAELRVEEMGKNHKCEYCLEFVFPDDDECRFCGGSKDKKPRKEDTFLNKPIDAAYLKEIVLYEAAWRIISGADRLAQNILDASGITQEQINQEILRQRGPNATLPMPRFCKRLIEFKLTSYWSPDSLSISRLVDLGSALDAKKVNRLDEAYLVYEHGLKRTENREDLMHERGRVLEYLALYYRGRDDFDKYKHYHKMSQECETYGMDDAMKAMILESDQNMMSMFTEDMDMSPEKLLENFGAQTSGADDMLDILNDRMNSAIPGLGDAMSVLKDSLNDKMQGTRLALEGQVAMKNGDLDLAETKYKEAIVRNQDAYLGGSTADLFCSLAEVQHLKGNDAEAEASLIEAMKSADEYHEANPDFGKTTIANCMLAMACFQRDAGRLEEAERNFKKASDLQAEATAEYVERYGGGPEQYSGGAAKICDEYAKLLRACNRIEEAEKMEQEASRLQEEVKKEENRQREHRAKFARGIGE